MRWSLVDWLSNYFCSFLPIHPVNTNLYPREGRYKMWSSEMIKWAIFNGNPEKSKWRNCRYSSVPQTISTSWKRPISRCSRALPLVRFLLFLIALEPKNLSQAELILPLAALWNIFLNGRKERRAIDRKQMRPIEDIHASLERASDFENLWKSRNKMDKNNENLQDRCSILRSVHWMEEIVWEDTRGYRRITPIRYTFLCYFFNISPLKIDMKLWFSQAFIVRGKTFGDFWCDQEE